MPVLTSPHLKAHPLHTPPPRRRTPLPHGGAAIIDDATKRLGSAEDNRCRVTVTDNFGGRGHDFQVVDKEANASGGMLVIATSVPDKREWIQWKGRTARQDRPGQFQVVLNLQAKPFSEPKHKKLAQTLRGLPSEDAK
eukprot:4646849-Prymnesium_polylepis.1